MNKIYFLPMILAALSLAACSDDAPQEADIAFSASINSAVNPPATAMINGSTFYVTAFTDLDSATPTTILDNVEVSKNDNRYLYSPQVPWPGGAVDFYAYSPAMDNDVTITPSLQGTYYVNRGTDDFLFASAKGLKRTIGAVNLNFRHALARVTFKFLTDAGSASMVEINGVRLNGVIGEGAFTWPKGSTGVGSPFYPGTWSINPSVELRDYVIAQEQPQPAVLGNEPEDLCTTMCYFFIPQSLKYVNRAGEMTLTANVRITDNATGKVKWPAEGGFGTVTIPVATKDCSLWDQSRDYTYEITVKEDATTAVKVTHT